MVNNNLTAQALVKNIAKYVVRSKNLRVIILQKYFKLRKLRRMDKLSAVKIRCFGHPFLSVVINK